MDGKAAFRVLRENVQKSQEEVSGYLQQAQIRFLENRHLMSLATGYILVTPMNKMRKSRLQPLVAFRARTRFLRVVGGSCSFGVAGKKLALAGRKLKHFQEMASLFLPFSRNTKTSKVTCLATFHCASCCIGLFILLTCTVLENQIPEQKSSSENDAENRPCKRCINKHLTRQKGRFQLLPCSLQKHPQPFTNF